MIYLSKDHLKQVEYLIRQARLGNHILFPPEVVRRIMSAPDARCTEEEAYSAEPHLERILTLSTLNEKRAYLDGLDTETFELVVKTYFNIVENNLYEAPGARH